MDNQDNRTMADLAREAMQVQDACNLSGVAHGFSRAISRLRVLLDAVGKGGTDAVNRHPICVMWTDKMADLAGRESRYSQAYYAVGELAEGRALPSTWEVRP